MRKEQKSSRFPAWEKVIGGILETANVEGFLANHKDARDTSDPVSQAWRGLVEAWRERFGQRFVTVKDLLEIVGETEIGALLPEKDRGKVFGKMLQARRDKVIADYKITRNPERKRLTEWQLVEVTAKSEVLN